MVVVVSEEVSQFLVYFTLWNMICLKSLGYSVNWCSVCSECCIFCLNCGACSSRGCLIDSRLVSLCICYALVCLVHPVAIGSTVFYMTCSLFVYVSDIMGEDMELLYSSVVLVIAVYVFSNVSFYLPQWDVESALLGCSLLCLWCLVCASRMCV